MIKLYNWLVCKLFKKCSVEVSKPKQTPFCKYCQDNPWAVECRIYDV